MSTITRLLTEADRVCFESYLTGHLSTSLFLLSNSRQAGLTYTGKAYSGDHVAVFKEQKLSGILCHTWNGNLLPQARVENLEALLVELQEHSQRDIAGVVGPSPQVKELERLLGIKSEALKLNSDEILFELKLSELRIPETLNKSGITAAKATTNETEILSQWRVAYSVEVLGETNSLRLNESCREQMERAIAEERVWILKDGDQTVACAGFNAQIAEAVQIGGVYTPPNLRGRGYARAVTAAALRYAASQECGLSILFTEHNNSAAKKAYESIGFKPVGTFRLAILAQPLRIAHCSDTPSTPN